MRSRGPRRARTRFSIGIITLMLALPNGMVAAEPVQGLTSGESHSLDPDRFVFVERLIHRGFPRPFAERFLDDDFVFEGSYSWVQDAGDLVVTPSPMSC